MKGLSGPVILQLIGVVVIVAEIILPSGGLLSLLAISVFGYSLYLVFTTLSTQTGIIFTVVDVVTIPILVVIGLKMLAKSPVTLNTRLSKESGVTSQAPELEIYQDKEGIALTPLRPAGTAKIDGQRVDVVSQGEFIEKNSLVVVTAVTGNQIIVARK